MPEPVIPAPIPPTMQAWVVTRYGGPEVLRLEERPLPHPGPRQLLLRVLATTVSSGDRRVRAFDLPRGFGLIGRIAFGVRRPRRSILGAEAVGEVIAVGPSVTRFAPGDRAIVFTGAGFGAHASHLIVDQDRPIVPCPPSLPLDRAAALGFGGLTAIDYLRRAGMKAGERILVIGGSGTVGSAIVQLAADHGAHVTAVSSAANRDLVLGLGAHEAIDRAGIDLRALGPRFDVVADTVGALTFRTSLPLLTEGGRYLAIAGDLSQLLARKVGSRRPIAGPASERPEDLATLVALATAGRFRPLIDGIVPFAALPEAHARVDTGRKRGSVVVVPG